VLANLVTHLTQAGHIRSNPSELKNQGRYSWGLMRRHCCCIYLVFLPGYQVLGLRAPGVPCGWRRLIHQVTQDVPEGLERVQLETSRVLLFCCSSARIGLERLRLSSLGIGILPGQTAD